MIQRFHLGLALFGLFFLVGCGEHEAAIKALYVQWHVAIEEKRFDDAYVLMAEEYRAKNTVEEFRDHYTRFFVPPPLSPDAIVERTCIVPSPLRDGDVIHGTLYGIERKGDAWQFTGVDGGYNLIIGDK